MGTVIITGLVALLSIFAVIHTLKDKNILGLALSLGSLGVFGFFTVATVFFDGFPK